MVELAESARDLGDRLENPDLIVGQEDRDKERVGPQSPDDRLRVEQAIGPDPEQGHVISAPFERGDRIEDRLVLGDHREDVTRSPRTTGARRGGGPQDCQVVRLGGATCENDLAGAPPEEARDGRPGLFDRSLRFLAIGVGPARRVPEAFREPREHRLEYGRIHGSRGVMVEIDRTFGHDCERSDSAESGVGSLAVRGSRATDGYTNDRYPRVWIGTRQRENPCDVAGPGGSEPYRTEPN